MTPQTPDILSVTGQTGALNGTWYAVPGPKCKTHHTVHISITAGTASVDIEVRNSANDATYKVSTGNTATIEVVVARGGHIRAVLTAAAAATVRVSLEQPTRPA